MGDRAVATPAGAIKGLRPGNDVLDRVGMATDAIGLDDLVGLCRGADGGRVGLESEGEYILHAGIAFIEIIADDVLMGQVTVGTDSVARMRGVVPVLVLVVHDMAVVAGGGFVGEIGGCVRYPRKDSQGYQ